MIRQEAESSPSVVSNGSTLIADPLLVEPLAGAIPDRRVPHREFPHLSQHCGAEGWVFNRDYSSEPESSNLLITAHLSGGRRERLTTVAPLPASFTSSRWLITSPYAIPISLAAVARSSTGWFCRSSTGRCTAFAVVVTAGSWSSTGWLAARSAGRTAAVVATVQLRQTQLWQLELGHVQLRQLDLRHLEAALLFAAAVASAAIATTVTTFSRSCTGGVNWSCTGRSTAFAMVVTAGSWSCTGGVNRSCTSRSTAFAAVVTAGSRSCTGRINRSSTGCFNAAATSIVMLEQTEQTGLCAVGDREYHQSGCECHCLHLKFS